MTIRKEGEKRRLPERTFLMRPRIICSQALKSAITPSLSGRITRILLPVFSSISLAVSPTAIIFSVCWYKATKLFALAEFGAGAAAGEDVHERSVFRLRRNDDDVLEVFGCCSDERDAADVNLLDDVCFAGSFFDSLREGVKVHDDEVYFGDVIAFHFFAVFGVFATFKDASGNFRVMRFEARD